MDPTHLLAWLKQPTKAIATVFIVALALRLLPMAWLEWLRAAELRDASWLGVVLLGSGVFLAIEGALAIIASLRRRAERSKHARDAAAVKEAEAVAARERERKEREEAAAELRRGLDFLARMTASERLVCRRFIESRERTLDLDVQDRVVSELARRRVIIAVSMIHHSGSGDAVAAFTMNDWAWDHLRERAELLRN